MGEIRNSFFYLERNFNIGPFSSILPYVQPISIEKLAGDDAPKLLLYNLDQNNIDAIGRSDEIRLLESIKSDAKAIQNVLYVLCTFVPEAERSSCNFLKEIKFFLDFMCRSCNAIVVDYFYLAALIKKIEKVSVESYLHRSQNALFMTCEILGDPHRSIFQDIFKKTNYEEITGQIALDSSGKIFPDSFLSALINAHQSGADVLAHALGHKSEAGYFENLGDLKGMHEKSKEFLRDSAARRLNELLIDLAGIVCSNPFELMPAKEGGKEQNSILFIDDNLDDSYFTNYLRHLQYYMPHWKIYGLFNYKKLISTNLSDLKKISDKIKLAGMFEIKCYVNKSWHEIDEFDLGCIQFVCIDLLFNRRLLGFDILRLFRKFNESYSFNIKPIILSRSSRPEYVQVSLNEGAIGFINKERFLKIPAVLSSVTLPREDRDRFYRTFENWHRLSKLPVQKICELQKYEISGNEYNPKAQKNEELWENLENSEDYSWIKKLPKADLHCHIGSCMGPDLLPTTALIVLSELYNWKRISDKVILAILEFVYPFVQDKFLGDEPDDIGIISPMYVRYRSMFIRNDVENNKSDLFELADKKFALKANQKTPEEVLLSPQDTTLERLGLQTKTNAGSYFERKLMLRNLGVQYEVIMLFFILLIYIRETKDVSLKSLKSKIKELNSDIKKIDKYAFISISKFLSRLHSLFNQEALSEAVKLIVKMPKGNILGRLQSAHSVERCLKEKSLFNYLRGCEYGGAAHLQTKAAIYFATKYIIHNYALKDNIRYLELRCAVDGYSKLKLQSNAEALEALLRGFDYFSALENQKGRRVHINIVIGAKRHKSEEEFQKNVDLALNYRYGLRLNAVNNDGSGNGEALYKKSRVVSFDLSGLEKGNRPSKFMIQFAKLHKECFPITIHAGEEDDYESIWEAIYLVQSQRIGHGLTLRQKPELLAFVRERHIAIELCPVSNILTSNNYKFPEGKKRKGWELKSSAYPLKQYLEENLDVTVNTDNPFISNTDLTKELLVASRLSGRLTKWEILRLIKNGFRAAAIPKKEKRMLMNEIDEEIYDILLRED